MKKTLLIWGIFICAFSAVFSQSIIPTHIYFKSGSDQLSLKSKAELDRFCKDLEIKPSSVIEIVGHTDNIGKDAANIDLALRRAQQTKAYLTQQGIEGARILLAALGETQPLASNEQASGRKQNRRVSFAIGDGTFAWVKSSSSLIYQNKEQLETLAELDVDDLNPREKLFNSLLHSLEIPGQKFRINTRIESHIRGKQGTLVYIPRGVFEAEDGSEMTEEVEVVVTEFYSRSDMILGNLNSMSANGLLESGGMLNIQAYSGDKKLRLKEGRKLEVYLPTEKVEEGMELFMANSPSNTELVSDIWEMDTTWRLPDPSRRSYAKELWYVNKKENRKWLDFIQNPNLLYITGDTVWQNKVPVIIEREAAIPRPRAIPSVFRAQSKPDFYLFNVARLGWINCDRFRRDARPKTNLFVKSDKNRPMIIRLIFKDMNALMSGSSMVNEYMSFRNLPVGQQVIVVAIAKGEGKDQYEYGFKEISIERGLKIDDLALKKGSKTDLKEMLIASLD